MPGDGVVDGIDNAFGQALWGHYPDWHLDGGTAGPPYAETLLRVRGYNDAKNDDEVEVCLYGAYGHSSTDGGNEVSWNDSDPWAILTDWLAPSSDGGSPDVRRPRFCDQNAYVAGGLLVAQFAKLLWPSSSNLAPGRGNWVEHVILAGPLIQTGGQWALQGVVTDFAMFMADSLAAAADLPVSTDQSQPNCAVESAYNSAKALSCSYADLQLAPTPTSSVCDAISVGFEFDAQEAQIGGIASRPPTPPDCNLSFYHPGDTCGP